MLLIAFASASSSLRPADLSSSLPLRAVLSDLLLGLRAHRHPDKLVQRFETLSWPLTWSLVRLAQRLAIDPCWPSLYCSPCGVVG